jgi:hypothetical protein
MSVRETTRARRNVAAIAFGAVIAMIGCAEPAHVVGLSIEGTDYFQLSMQQPQPSSRYTGQLDVFAYAFYSDGAVATVVTGDIDWASSDTSVAAVSDVGQGRARVDAVASGDFELRATYEGVSATVPLTVVP